MSKGKKKIVFVLAATALFSISMYFISFFYQGLMDFIRPENFTISRHGKIYYSETKIGMETHRDAYIEVLVDNLNYEKVYSRSNLRIFYNDCQSNSGDFAIGGECIPPTNIVNYRGKMRNNDKMIMKFRLWPNTAERSLQKMNDKIKCVYVKSVPYFSKEFRSNIIRINN